MSDVENAAGQVRMSWGLGFDPIGSVVSAVEEHGVKAVMIDDVEGFDGFSCVANESIPVIAVPAGLSGDRQRFTLASELGHMVLDTAPDVDEEKAAHRFAGAFLAPRKAVISELGPQRSRLDIDELAILKRSYGMSMQAWACRMFGLGIIQREAYEPLFRSRIRIRIGLLPQPGRDSLGFCDSEAARRPSETDVLKKQRYLENRYRLSAIWQLQTLCSPIAAGSPAKTTRYPYPWISPDTKTEAPRISTYCSLTGDR